MKAEQTLTRSAIVSGIKKTWIADDLWYCIHFYQLNGQGIASKYKTYFANATASELATIKHEVESRYQFVFDDLEELFHPLPDLQVNMIKFLKSELVNSGLSGLVRKGNFLLDTALDKFSHRGIVFKVMGSDETAKSTVVIN